MCAVCILYYILYCTSAHMCRQNQALFVLYIIQQKHFINYKLGYNLGSSSIYDFN